MAIRARIEVGDVFAIPLADEKYALALCLFVFGVFKNCIACRVFDAVVESPNMVDPMPSKIAVNPLFMGKQIITAGTWPIVGKMETDNPRMVFRVADGKYDGDQYVGPIGTEVLPNLEACGPVAVQNLLRRRFGLE
jgi:immunity protein 26 of polymorphic toxin system